MPPATPIDFVFTTNKTEKLSNKISVQSTIENKDNNKNLQSN